LTPPTLSETPVFANYQRMTQHSVASTLKTEQNRLMKRTCLLITLLAAIAAQARKPMIATASAGSQIVGQSAHSNQNQTLAADLTPVEQNGKWGYADKDGKIVIKPQFTRAHRFSEGLALVWTGGIPLTDPIVTSFVNMGYIDGTGHWVIHSRYKYYFYDDFSEGLAPFRQQSSKWGYINPSGKIVVRPRFDWAGGFSKGIAPVLLDSKCAHVDKTGKITDQSPAVLPRRKFEQDRHGTFQQKPDAAPCP
jgi:hypothetical protein